MLFLKMQMLQRSKEMLKRRLKNCKSKEEVNNVMHNEINMIRKEDPDRDMKLKAVLKAEKEFKKSGDFRRLPEKKRNPGN